MTDIDHPESAPGRAQGVEWTVRTWQIVDALALLCELGQDQRRFEENYPELNNTEVVAVTTMLLRLSAE